MLSMVTTNDEKRKLVNEQEACNTSAEESLDVEDEYIDHDYMNLAPKHICTMWCGSDFKSILQE